LHEKDVRLMRPRRFLLRVMLLVLAVALSPGPHAAAPVVAGGGGGSGNMNRQSGGNQIRQSGAGRNSRSGDKRGTTQAKMSKQDRQKRQLNARTRRGVQGGRRGVIRRNAPLSAAGATTPTLPLQTGIQPTSASAAQLLTPATGTVAATGTVTVTGAETASGTAAVIAAGPVVVTSPESPRSPATPELSPRPLTGHASVGFQARLAEMPQADREKLAAFYQSMSSGQREAFRREMVPLSPDERAARLTEKTGVPIPPPKAPDSR
jgi:hypothetical protein